MITWLRGLGRRSLMLRAAILGLAPLLVLLAMGPLVARYGGIPGLVAAATAAALCLAGAVAALAIGNRLRHGPHEMLAALLIGTTLRTGIPLIFGLAIHLSGALPARAGVLYYLFVFYPVTLAVGTLLSLPAKPPLMPRREASPNALG